MRKAESGEAWARSWSAELLPMSVCICISALCRVRVNEVLQAAADLSFTLQSCVDLSHWTPELIRQTGCQRSRKPVWSEWSEITSTHIYYARLLINRHRDIVCRSRAATCLLVHITGHGYISQNSTGPGVKELRRDNQLRRLPHFILQ